MGCQLAGFKTLLKSVKNKVITVAGFKDKPPM